MSLWLQVFPSQQQAESPTTTHLLTSEFAPSLFFARDGYDPALTSAADTLPLNQGDYVYVHGEVDEEGFCWGQLVDGRRGRVPRVVLERLSDDPCELCMHA